MPSPRVRSRTPLALVAAVLTVVSLGLPWTPGSASQYVPGFVTPGFCSPISGDCTPMTATPGYTIGGSSGLTGAESYARVGIVLVLVLGLLAWRSGSRVLAVAALVTAGIAVAMTGLSVSAGAVALLAGAALFFVAAGGRAPTPGREPTPA